MTEYVESKTLQNLVKRLENIANRRSVGNYVAIAALHSALIAREQLGVRRYGKTLDDQAGYAAEFWMLMGLDEILDGMMYIQKAAETGFPTKHLGLPGQLISNLADAAGEILELARPDALKQLVSSMLRPDLFPPAELRKESNERP